MTRTITAATAALATLLALGLPATAALAGPVGEGHAHAAEDAPLVEGPWARPTIPNRPTAAYFRLVSQGTADRLVGVFTPAFGRTELHLSSSTDGVMRMEKVEAIDLPAGGEAVLKPGGYHVMLFDAVTELGEGDTFPLMLSFENAGTVTVETTVRRRAPDDSTGADHGHGSHGHGGHGHGGHGGHGSAETN
ncbi:MAG: copper chaperone PCu(A)C [Pseudomonadota bacterium]